MKMSINDKERRINNINVVETKKKLKETKKKRTKYLKNVKKREKDISNEYLDMRKLLD